MRPDSPFHRFDTPRECIGVVYGEKLEELSGTNGKTYVLVPQTLQVRFNVQGRASRWPDVLSTTSPCKLFKRELAEKITRAQLSGIDFHPVQLILEELRGLKKKVDECPEYVWGRVFGEVFVELSLRGRALKSDPTGRYLPEEPPVTEVLDARILQSQPNALDFSRVLPGGSPVGTVLSQKAVGFFDTLKLKDVIIFVMGNGYL